MSPSLTVELPGSAVVTDLGRVRGPEFGLPANGALDRYSARVANILVNNDQRSPLIEVTAFDVRLVPDSDVLIAVTGAELTLTVGGRLAPQWQPVFVRAGESIFLHGITSGLRAYLAVFGSIDAPRLLGSCAPDTVIGFGLHLAKGQRLSLLKSCPPVRQPYFDQPLFVFPVRKPTFNQDLLVEVTDGPDAAEFGESAELLFRDSYVVSPRSNHIGLRLAGTLPERTSQTELLSRGVPIGAIEVPSREELLVLHRGRGVTAGYPVLAVATADSLDVLGQARPGQEVRFRRTTVAEAAAGLRAKSSDLHRLKKAVSTAFNLLGVGATHPRNKPATA